MIPIQDLLNRIRWDPEFGRGQFALGYLDRIAGRLIRVPLARVEFDPQDHFSFQFTDAEGETLSIPLHRIYEVYRNGERIWHRELP